MEECDCDISDLEKEEANQLFVAVLDAWTVWPKENAEAWNAAPQMLRSLAVAGGWDQWIDSSADA